MPPKSTVLLLVLLVAASAAFAEEGLGERVEALVARLASESFRERRAAYEELEDLGAKALPWLRSHVDAEDPEVARLVGRLVNDLATRDEDALLSALSSRDNGFPDSEDFERIVRKGRPILPEIYRVLDEQDATYPNYDYWTMKNAFAVLAELTDESDLDRLLGRLDHPNPQQRYLLAPLLRDMDRDVVLGRLLGLVADPEAPAQARAHAIEMSRDSGLTGNDERFPPLVERLLGDDDPLVRAAAVSWFAFRRSDDVTGKLVAATRDDDPGVRLAAVRALRNYRGEKVREAVEAALRDPVGSVRAGAVEALRNLAGPGLAPRLRPFLKDPDPMVRANAAQTLAQMGDQAALPALVGLLDERGEEFLMRALHSVVSAVGRIGDEAAIPALLDLLEDSRTHPRIESYRYLILSSILKLGGDEVFPKVKGWLTGGQVQNRHVVLDALAGLESPEALAILVDALENGEKAERNSAVRALLARNHAEAAPAILEAMRQEDDPWFLSEATKAMVAFGHEPAVPEMLALLELDPKDGRNTALFYSLIRAMVRFRVADAAPRIAEILSLSPSYHHRGVEALGRLGNPDAVPALEKFVTDPPSATLHFRAAISLAQLGEPGALESMLDSGRLEGDPLPRAEALIALGRADAARKILEEETKRGGSNGTTLYNVACYWVRLGDHDRAFTLFEHALDLRPRNAAQIQSDADLDPLRGDPRFEALLKNRR